MSLTLTGENSWDSSVGRECSELADELKEKGVPLLRVTRNYNVKKVLISFSPVGDGLQCQPASEHHSSLLFADMWAIRSLPPSDKICSKAGLTHFQYCFQVESQFGWSWNLVCNTALERSTWVDFLEQRRRTFLDKSRANAANASVERYWFIAAQQGKTKLSFNEISMLANKLFGRVPPAEFADRFRQCDSDKDTCLNYQEFCEFFHYFNEAKAVRSIYERQTSDGTPGMTAEEFTRFCIANDAVANVTPMRCASLFHLFANRQSDRMALNGFTAFLLHPHHNTIVDARQLRLTDSMDHLLPHYFINSSHNTYLTGNQLNSESSCNMYRDVLLAGCRCVEIDCWDGPAGVPVVYHGRTMTTKIAFDDVVRTINDYAFQNPSDNHEAAWNPREFPVIVSLEVHTSPEQTNRMAEIIRSVFKERLFLSRLDASSYTPAKLKGKILVKWKMNAAGVEDLKDTAGSGIRADRRAPLLTTLKLSACASIGTVRSTSWGAEEQPFNVQSYVEGEVARLEACSPVDFARQNTRMLSRIYPAGTRIDSSNYDPMLMWRLGCQMVALNWQTRDHNFRVNEGFFTHQNGGCGYVLKPMHLRDVGGGCSAIPFTLALRLICGSHLGTTFDGADVTHVSLRVWVHGEAWSHETIAVPTTIYPEWNERMELQGRCKETAVLCLCVVAHTRSGTTHDVCTACIPVRVLRTGYHAMPLRHAKSGHTAEVASVLCHLSFKTPALFS
ncbi:phosphatidylinositol-specific phospholipase-like protein [Leishmania donovani]|uniref:Phosphoinositide phospholipase C n=1 Tax=Leishmania donovani TaxID=5661 RepID=E9BRN6_LEIDO|nr:phosphatidylinositol-specific phospholipase-like protein [Leishmania donovani]CBZ37915.1 phosphatidylinositol-specific phospholipase-like protein [Leishmania donovani]